MCYVADVPTLIGLVSLSCDGPDTSSSADLNAAGSAAAPELAIEVNNVEVNFYIVHTPFGSKTMVMSALQQYGGPWLSRRDDRASLQIYEVAPTFHIQRTARK
jgi:hypothetical protein